ncbi:unnamed protein product [Candida verbasci]|uniref:Acireductone dioxygenase n=1 Tax=Candida verbasci TaxID=1227364 RepID=A0A9W4TVG2_9ASCO|nr:unnamed protein product [Candida verbasci]
MVEVYYHDNKDTIDDFTEPHNSGVPVSLDTLSKIGVFYRQIKTQEDLDNLATQRDYKNRDEVNLNLAAFNNDINAYNAKMQQFYKEHYHEDEEIRYIVDGEGYFDVRDENDKWIRTKLNKYDLLILPAGIYHRFTLTDDLKYVRAVRLFKDEPKWEAINRDTGKESEVRLSYAQSIVV